VCDPTHNLARDSGVSASSSGGGSGGSGPPQMIDGNLEAQCVNSGVRAHWISAGDTPGGEWARLDFAQPVQVGRIWIDTTALSGGCVYSSGRTCAGGDVQYWNGSSWVTVGTVSSQTNDWTYSLPSPVTTTRLRIYNIVATSATGQQSNPVIFEWRVYCD
jgi:hypothetical protein